MESDNIEAHPHETPTLVLGFLEAGTSPNDAVTGLVRHALRIADGFLPDLVDLREQLDDERAEETPEPQPRTLRPARPRSSRPPP
ncbi:hypothetical protein F7Q99_28940 [Streptomyces kaniharaensis]|uniref:Uncharacterized protein n=1 Tax=Streptomyces kaniharaensis TaxID=212423 RepID=A0A6N7L0R4_9ACTN|nr:hypothetical protein [Streptomyces kaniharaensis]MQS16148.1 hypothetical protein [Streptomyces kaniharaensis]